MKDVNKFEWIRNIFKTMLILTWALWVLCSTLLMLPYIFNTEMYGADRIFMIDLATIVVMLFGNIIISAFLVLAITNIDIRNKIIRND